MLRRFFWQGVWFYRRKLRGARRIRGLVLDVGSGNSPHPRADVLAEKFLSDDSNRIRGRAVVLVAPVVACDAEALPFANDTFDFVVCSHLIEHVDHPDLVLAELSRVGKAGYIECPNRDYDKLDTPAYHRWFASAEGDELVLDQKDSAIFDPGVKDLVHETLYRDSGFWSVFWRHLDRFFVMFQWEGSIPFRVNYLDLADGSPGSAAHSRFDEPGWAEAAGFTEGDVGQSSRVGSFSEQLIRAVWRLFKAMAGSGPKVDLDALLVCPADQGELERNAGELTCTRCGVNYEVASGIPQMYRKS